MTGMQFGIFTVGDVTPDPTTGRAPTEAERIRATVAIAKKAEEVGLDVFATGEHHNPPFVPSSPTTLLGYIAAQTERIILSTSTTLITTNDPVKIAEDFSRAAAPVRRTHRPDAWAGQHRAGVPVVRAGHPRGGSADGRALRAAAPAVAGGGGRLGRASSAPRCRASPSPPGRWTASRRSCGTARSARRRSPNWPPTTATGSSPTTSSGPPSHTQRMVQMYRQRFEHYGHGTRRPGHRGPGRAGLHAPEQPGRGAEFRPYFDNAPVYGHGPSLEEFTAQTPLTVGLARHR